MALPTFTIKLSNESIISRFVEQVMEDDLIKQHIVNKMESEREKFNKMLYNMKLYENPQNKKEIYFRLSDVSVLLGIDKNGAKKRVVSYTPTEVAKAELISHSSRSIEFTFLTQAGLIKFIYNSKSNISRVFAALFTEMILEVCKDKKVIAAAIRNTFADCPDDMLEFVDVISDRSYKLKQMYELERERNEYLTRQAELYQDRIEENCGVIEELNYEKAILVEHCDMLSYEKTLSDDDNYVNFLRNNFLRKIYVYLIDHDELLKCMKSVVIRNNYQKDMEECYKYNCMIKSEEMGYKLVEKKVEGRVHVKIEYVNSIETYTKIKKELTESASLLSSAATKTGAIYVYGQYDIVEQIFDQFKQDLAKKI